MQLTNSQVKVFNYCREFFFENDQIPPAHVISNHFGWASPSAANEQLIRLAKKGYLAKNTVGKYRFTRRVSNENTNEHQ